MSEVPPHIETIRALRASGVSVERIAEQVGLGKEACARLIRLYRIPKGEIPHKTCVRCGEPFRSERRKLLCGVCFQGARGQIDIMGSGGRRSAAQHPGATREPTK